MAHRHRYDLDTDRCHCGGEVVYFEADIPEDGPEGEGCEVEGRPWTHIENRPPELGGQPAGWVKGG